MTAHRGIFGSLKPCGFRGVNVIRQNDGTYLRKRKRRQEKDMACNLKSFTLYFYDHMLCDVNYFIFKFLYCEFHFSACDLLYFAYYFRNFHNYLIKNVLFRWFQRLFVGESSDRF